MDEPARRALRHLPPAALTEMIAELSQETREQIYDSICRQESFQNWFAFKTGYDIDVENRDIW